MSLRLRIAANTIVQMLGKGINAGTSLLITILIARYFGVSGFGEYVKIISYATLFYLPVDFGLNAVVLRKIEETDDQGLLSSLMVLRLILGSFWIFIALAVLSFLPADEATGMGYASLTKLGVIVVLPTVMNQGIFVTVNAWFQRCLRYDQSVIASSFGAIVLVSLVYLFIRAGASLTVTLVSYFLGTLVMVIVALKIAGWPLFFRAWSLTKIKEIFIKGWPLGLTLVFSVISFRAGVIILSFFRAPVEVGIYGLAYRIFELILTIPTFFMNALYPVMLKRKKLGFGALMKVAKKSLYVLLLMSLLTTGGSFFLSHLITYISPEFEASITVFRLLVSSLPIFFVSSLTMWILITLARNLTLFFIYGGVMTINLALNFLLIPRHGYFAAAAITILSELLLLVIAGYVGWRTLRNEDFGGRI